MNAKERKQLEGVVAQGRDLVADMNATLDGSKAKTPRPGAPHTRGKACIVDFADDSVGLRLGNRIAVEWHGDKTMQSQEDRANLRRVVACWNACDGIDLNDLEKGRTWDKAETALTARAQKAERQRDDLIKLMGDLARNDEMGTYARQAIVNKLKEMGAW